MDMNSFRIYDISQEVFKSEVYPGDPAPKRQVLSSMENGDLYNLTSFSMCAHNGTHIDAPYHFISNGKKVDEIEHAKFVGPCFVAEYDGILSAADAADILFRASDDAKKRILIKGDVTVSAEAAKVFADGGVYLLGNESQTVGPCDAPMEVHKILLSHNVVLLEGIRLGEVETGEYFLCAMPLLLSECDGAPTRAFLLEFVKQT